MIRQNIIIWPEKQPEKPAEEKPAKTAAKKKTTTKKTVETGETT